MEYREGEKGGRGRGEVGEGEDVCVRERERQRDQLREEQGEICRREKSGQKQVREE